MAGAVVNTVLGLGKNVLSRKIATGMTVGQSAKSEMMNRVVGKLGELGKNAVSSPSRPETPDHRPDEKPDRSPMEKIRARPIKKDEDGEAVKDHTGQLVTGLRVVQTSTDRGFEKVGRSTHDTSEKITRGMDRVTDAVKKRALQGVTPTRPHWLDQPRDERGRFKKADEASLLSRVTSAAAIRRNVTGRLGKIGNFLGRIGIGAGVGFSAYDKYNKTGRLDKAIVSGVGTGVGMYGGAIAGQAAIPVPVLGALLGSAAGGFIGEKIASGGYDWLDKSVRNITGMFVTQNSGKTDGFQMRADNMIFDAADKIIFQVERSVTFKQGGVGTLSGGVSGGGGGGGGGGWGGGPPQTGLEEETGSRSGGSGSRPGGPPRAINSSSPTGSRPRSGGGGGSGNQRPSNREASPNLAPPDAGTADRKDKFGGMANSPRIYQRQRGESGEFNYSLSREGIQEFGEPGKAPMSTIKTLGGLTAQVNAKTAQQQQDFLHEIERRGYKIGSVGGYSYRGKAGGGGLSTHATGTTMDVNPGANAMDGRNRTDMPPNMEKIGWVFGLSSGYKFGDAMHFEKMSPRLWHKRLDQLAKEGFITREQAEKIKGGEQPANVMGWRGSPNVAEQVIDPEKVKSDEKAAQIEGIKSSPLGRGIEEMKKKNAPAEEKDPLHYPTSGRVSSLQGNRSDPFLGRPAYHGGTDIAGPLGTPIKSIRDGEVVGVGRMGGYGNQIRVRHRDGTESTYSHLSTMGVKVGQQIRGGEVIGGMGSTGRSTGSHLHFEMERNGQKVAPEEIRNLFPDFSRVNNQIEAGLVNRPPVSAAMVTPPAASRVDTTPKLSGRGFMESSEAIKAAKEELETRTGSNKEQSFREQTGGAGSEKRTGDSGDEQTRRDKEQPDFADMVTGG